ncbi:hypothetical protein COEREDRAFT_9044 [Coemansia reversa NRRL 1564]|uniref:Protein Asterix n=1 Tax=Coemansia reversa (strain ATCC 12441 / NRRL 1564) TaxID=763665 RepID=A0A2G5BAR8_COERN|nr:hypothetical protein COEREDRAFT_9044 [Coemansia reversa NRRL 1564]|eukprot:PIA15807.1 hypothetical protein COEREDRAFT_9044 [Coemansia reversa NRRL 1564]
MPRREFPGDPRSESNIVPYQPATSNSEGSIYYLVAFGSSMAALFLKSKWIAWLSLFSSLLSVFTERQSASSSGSTRLSTITLALTSLMMTYMPEMVNIFKLKGTTSAPATTQ